MRCKYKPNNSNICNAYTSKLVFLLRLMIQFSLISEIHFDFISSICTNSIEFHKEYFTILYVGCITNLYFRMPAEKATAALLIQLQQLNTLRYERTRA